MEEEREKGKKRCLTTTTVKLASREMVREGGFLKWQETGRKTGTRNIREADDR